MTVRREDGQGMRHSSSWPDRSQRTVRVRVDPLSRAFTIVPTSSNHRSSEEEEEKSMIFDKSLKHDVTIEDKIEKEEKGEYEDVVVDEDKVKNPMVEIEGKSRAHREFQRKTLHSSLRALNRHRLYVETSSLSSTISTASRRIRRSNSGGGGGGGGNSNGGSIELKIFDVASSIGLKYDDDVEERKEVGLSDDKRSQPAIDLREDEKEEEKSVEENVIEKRERSKQQPTVVLTPHIEIVDYDRIAGITTASSQSDQRHACPKCTSEGQLRLQVDPFRSPIAYDASSNGSINGSRPRPRSILSKKWREIDRSNTRGKSTCLDGRNTSLTGTAGGPGGPGGYLAKRESTLGMKKRNGLSSVNQQTCRPTYDLCKEATLRRHYYPEGGWGYVIVTCSMLVHFLGIGLQFAAPGTWHITAQLKFHHPPLHSAGTSFTFGFDSFPSIHPLRFQSLSTVP